MARAYIALGANLGDRLTQLAGALGRIDELDTVTVLSVSQAYESEPWGVTEQEPFANAVAAVDTELGGVQLLGLLQDIEREMGRRHLQRYGPRSIDLDILLIGDDEWNTADLTIPHPRMLEREFVVVPLLDVAPRVRMPDGSAVSRERAIEGHITGTLGAIPGYADRTTWGDGTRQVAADEQWVPVYERPGYNPLFAIPAGDATGLAAQSGTLISGNTPHIESNFAQLVLEQLGIPHVWDPFPPERSSDPYNLARPFRLLAPESLAVEARAALEEAASAEIQWDEVDGGAGDDPNSDAGYAPDSH